MALPALAPLSDLEIRLGLDSGTLSGADRLRAQAAIDGVSALARAETGRDWINEFVPEAVSYVVIGAALRAYRTPDGASEISQTVGPFSRTFKAAELSAYLTEGEKEILQRYRKANTALWTQRTTKDEDGDEAFYLNDTFGTEPIRIGLASDPW